MEVLMFKIERVWSNNVRGFNKTVPDYKSAIW